MERKLISEEQKRKLRMPLPAEAISKHPSKPYLSSIKAIYVTERLNEVFGIGSWTFQSKFIEKVEGMIVVYATLCIPDYGIELNSFGGNDNGGEKSKNFDLGDAYKGASTDALTKICSWLEIGIDVFKGQKSRPTQEASSVEPEKHNAQSVVRPYPVHETETTIDLNPDDLPAFLQTISELTTMDAWLKFAEKYAAWQEVKEFKAAMVASRIRLQAKESPITINQKSQILLLLNNSVISKEENEQMQAALNKLSTQRAEEAIIKLKKVIADRTPPLEPNTKKAKTEKQAA